ncbi:MAG: hypothetical protein QOH67_840 [Hyphomicrobiales bacterium]|nr:hypothetical protein [Hyphomicrobiales bacterium]
MNTLGTLVSYTVAVGVLVGGSVGGALWLGRPDPSVKYAARVAPIPPRIAESIERKRVPEPAPAPVPAVVSEPAPVKPAVLEREAALTQTPAKIKVRDLSPPSVKRKPPRETVATVLHAAASPVAITTGRTDFPY